jgi:hypothetical protein
MVRALAQTKETKADVTVDLYRPGQSSLSVVSQSHSLELHISIDEREREKKSNLPPGRCHAHNLSIVPELQNQTTSESAAVTFFTDHE